MDSRSTVLHWSAAILAAALVIGAHLKAHAASQGIQGTSYESVADLVTCTGLSRCTIRFPAIPAGKVIRIDHATCNVQSTQPIMFARFGPFASTGAQDPLKIAAMVVSANVSGPYYHFSTVDLTTPMFAGAGRFPGVTALFNGTSDTALLDCTLSGTVVSG